MLASEELNPSNKYLKVFFNRYSSTCLWTQCWGSRDRQILMLAGRSPKQEGDRQGTPGYKGTAPKIYHWLPNTHAHICTCIHMYAQRHTKEEEEETLGVVQRISNPTLRGAKTEDCYELSQQKPQCESLSQRK